MSVKVFKVNDCEWWAGDCTALEMLVAYLRFTGCSLEDATDGLLPVEVPQEEMKRLRFRHDDEGRQLQEMWSFEDELAALLDRGEKLPCLFASTEW